MEENTNESIPHECLSLVKQVINIAGGVFEIAALEAQLTVKSLLYILCISLSIVLVLASIWISLLMLIILLSILYNVPIFAIVLTILGLNALILVFLGFLLTRQKKNLGFKITKKQLDNPDLRTTS